jgi:cytochrome c-type biogenesis protein CcmH
MFRLVRLLKLERERILKMTATDKFRCLPYNNGRSGTLSLTYGILLFFLIIFILPLAVSALTVDEVGSELLSPDGCGMMLNVCESSHAQEMRNLIKEKIEQGSSKQEIIDYFVGQYGEKILAVPSKKGFNLTAWVTPFLALLFGAVAIMFLIASWAGKKGKPSKVAKGDLSPNEKAAFKAKIDKELKNFE